MEKPTVSTITPCYNMGRYLKLFLEKLPEQTYFDNLEVVLDHNAPTEEELEWVKAFQEKYPGRLKHNVIDHVDPIGPSMNRCIRESTGDFLTIWNVDDLRTPNSIESQANQLIEHSDASIVFGPYKVVNKFGNYSGTSIDNSELPESELTRGMIIGPFFMFRRSLLDEAGLFDEQFRSGADFDLAVRLAFHGKAITTKSELGYYLDEGLGASTRPNSRQPVERTVIELRYGIFDKLDLNYLLDTTSYNIPWLFWNNSWHWINDLVPEYDGLISEKRKNLNLVEAAKLYITNQYVSRKQTKWISIKKRIKKCLLIDKL